MFMNVIPPKYVCILQGLKRLVLKIQTVVLKLWETGVIMKNVPSGSAYRPFMSTK